MATNDPSATTEERSRVANSNEQVRPQIILIENTNHGYDYHIEQPDEEDEEEVNRN